MVSHYDSRLFVRSYVCMRREIYNASTTDTPVRGRAPETDKGRRTRRGADILQERRRRDTDAYYRYRYPRGKLRRESRARTGFTVCRAGIIPRSKGIQ